MELNLITELCEAQLFSTPSMLAGYTLKDIADLTFIYFMVLEIMNQEFSSAPVAKKYSRDTVSSGNFEIFRRSGTDLNIMLNILTTGQGEGYDRLSMTGHNDDFKRRIRLTKNDAYMYVLNITSSLASNSRTLFDIENKLAISDSNYRSVRRLVQDWRKISKDDRRLAATRLLQALRTRASRSELLPAFEKLVNILNLEIKDAKNPELDTKQATMKGILGNLALGLAAGIGGIGYGMYTGYKSVYGDDHFRIQEGIEFVEPTKNTEPESGYLYHAANRSRIFSTIASGKLQVEKPWAKDEATWPDGGTEPRLYWTPMANLVWHFVPEHGEPTIMRTKSSVDFTQESVTGDVYITKDIPISKIEVLTSAGWVKLTDLSEILA